MSPKEKKPRGKKNKELGKRGEQAAVYYLERSGYEIVETNWKCPAGEADIIARDGETIVFCEVKTRSNINKGFPSESVTSEKRAKYEKIAMWFLKEFDVVDVPVRFDVISLMVVSSDRAFIKHFLGAFSQGRL